MRANNFWNSFNIGFLGGMFNSHLFMGGMFGWNNFSLFNNMNFFMPNFNTFTFPSVFTPNLNSDYMFPSCESLKADFDSLFPLNLWQQPISNQTPSIDVFQKTDTTPSTVAEKEEEQSTEIKKDKDKKTEDVTTNKSKSSSNDSSKATALVSPKEVNNNSKEKKPVSQLNVSQNLFNFIKQHEGYSPVAYPDGNGYSIGYGHHRNDIYEGMRIDQAQADAYLKEDLKIAGEAVKKYVKVPLTQGQFDACASFVYSMGPTGFKNSTLLKLLNEGKYNEVANKFEEYVFGRLGKGKRKQKISSLVTRRKDEKALFLS